MNAEEGQPLEWVTGKLRWWYSSSFSWVLVFIEEKNQSTYSVVGGLSHQDFDRFFRDQFDPGFCGQVRIVANDKKYQSAIQKWISERNLNLEVKDFFYRKTAESIVDLSSGKIQMPKETKIKTKVLILDDSNSIRALIEKMILEDPDFEVCASIEDPRRILEAIQTHQPDVMTLDIHMPHWSGLDVLNQLSKHFPMPVIMVSAISLEEGDTVFRCLEAGAVDYIQKPSLSEAKSVGAQLREKLKAATQIDPDKIRARFKTNGLIFSSRIISENRKQSSKNQNPFSLNSKLILIGASTGGTEAIRTILEDLPDSIPPILIVQHIPPVFSKAFADRLNTLCPFQVAEAIDGEELKTNQVWIAPGGKQLRLKQCSDAIRLWVDSSPPVNRHQPSVDFMFNAIAELKPKKVLAILLTGMGTDGAKGLLNLKKIGSTTVAQDEKTSIVYGMPKAAAQLGAADWILPLDHVSGFIKTWMDKN